MTNALIADDEPHLAAYLREQLQRLWPGLAILPPARHGPEAAAMIAAERPDVAFLDIKMPGLTGLEVAQGIEGPTRVVFVTAYDEYAVQAFEQEAIDYVLKPVRADRLARTIERVQRALAAAPADDDARLATLIERLRPALPAAPPLRYLRAGQGDLTHQIDVDDVLFFHADDKYTVVRTAAGEHLIRTTIAELAQRLDPERYWQIHRSTIVNLRRVAGTRRDELSRLYVRMHGHDRELPVSRAYVHLFRAM
ncbi:MAG: response regulator transcription factor [Proteobacteria bacterium]|nr:response regulator transcription factor [Pseudomonadota bacterium]